MGRDDAMTPEGRRTALIRPVLAALSFALVAGGYACRVKPDLAPTPGPAATAAPKFTVQVGAFAVEENAARLAGSLGKRGLAVSLFLSSTGYFKVQVGAYDSRREAEEAGRSLLKAKAIDEYYVVPTESPIDSSAGVGREERLAEGLAATALSFIESPYAWGGASVEEGFDCSGLTMTVFRLNGISLPRAVSDQYGSGRPVIRERLRQGDLVFFATAGGSRPSHVGIYVGNQRFIHAPGANKTIRVDSLLNPYFSNRFVGARRCF